MYARTHAGVTPAWRRGARRLLGLLLPATCLGCGAVGDEALPLGLCLPCRARLAPPPSPACEVCGRSLPGAALLPAVRCPACQHAHPACGMVLAAWRYRPPLDQVVLAFKYGRLEYLGAHLARGIVRRHGAELAAADAVVPMPLPWWRRVRRGFNQAEAIAAPLAATLGLPLVDALRRGWAPRQTRLARSARRRNLEAAFRFAPSARRWAAGAVSGAAARPAAPDESGRTGAHVLLVDDVITTGATMEAAAACLIAAGVGRVTGVAAARTPHWRDGP